MNKTELLALVVRDPEQLVVCVQGILSRLAAAEVTIKHLLQFHGLGLMLKPPADVVYEYVAVRHRGNEVSLMNQGWSMWMSFAWDDEYCHLKPGMVLVMRRPRECEASAVYYYCLECEEQFVLPNGHCQPIQCPKGHANVGLIDTFVIGLLKKIGRLKQHMDEMQEVISGRDI